MKGLAMRLKNLLAILSFAGLASIFTTSTAHAYLDPGTASLILQGIIGVIGAGIVTLGIYWQKFTGLFRRKNDEDASDNKAP
jgi:hypothetical protein